MKKKLMIIGLDGASWPVLTDLVAKGRLPNIKKLMAQGASGPLMSLSVTASPIVWTSLATGKLPEKHGVQEFIVDTSALKTKRIWDIAEEHNMSIGIYGWLVTYPPRKVNGFLIPCWLATSPATYPDSLEFIKKIELGFKGKYSVGLGGYLAAAVATLQHGARLTTLLGLAVNMIGKLFCRFGPSRSEWRLRVLSMKLRMELFDNLVRQYRSDFSAVVISEIDNLSHRYWGFFEPAKFKHISGRDLKKFGDVIPTIYAEADKAIGRLLTSVADDTAVFVISDHGFQALTTPLRIRPEKIFSGSKFEDAFSHWYIGAELCLKSADHANGHALANEAVTYLEHCVLQEAHISLFEIGREGPNVVKVKVRKEVLDFPALMSATCRIGERNESFPDIMAEGGHLMTGFHAPEGIFIAKGKNIRANTTIQDASVLDVTPTILRLLDLPLDEQMDGKVLEQVLDEQFLTEHPVKTIPSYALAETDDESAAMDDESQQQIAERLKQLGYM